MSVRLRAPGNLLTKMENLTLVARPKVVERKARNERRANQLCFEQREQTLSLEGERKFQARWNQDRLRTSLGGVWSERQQMCGLAVGLAKRIARQGRARKTGQKTATTPRINRGWFALAIQARRFG
jgi:hypothetical protein